MLNVISITQARQNLSRLIDEVVRTQQPKILIRESKPQAVVLPYEQYLKDERNWKEEFNALLKKGQKSFRSYLKKRGIAPPKTEQAMYEFIQGISGRS